MAETGKRYAVLKFVSDTSFDNEAVLWYMNRFGCLFDNLWLCGVGKRTTPTHASEFRHLMSVDFL